MFILCRRGGDDLHQCCDNVIDVGKVAPHISVVEDFDRLLIDDCSGKGVVGHIRTSPGPIDGEEAQSGSWEAIQMGIGVGHQFIGFLGRCIETDRIIYLIVSRIGDLRIQPVDR